MQERLISIDVGNDSVKSFAGSFEDRIYIPNVIARVEKNRRVVEWEKDPLNGLHVEITSSALKRKNGTYAVGKLATQYHNNEELEADSEKSENDQSIIMLLTTLAFDAVQNFDETDGVIEASYYLSTGLPLEETEKKEAFKKKLKGSTHEVRFLKTPQYEGKVVQIKLKEALINTEGFAAYMDLMMNEDGSDRNQELQGKTIMINDIGGLSTDTAIILADGTIDNTNSSGLNEGVSSYLDEIIDRVYKEFKYPIKTRRELIDSITHPDPEERNHLYVKSNRTSIDHIVNPVMEKLALIEHSQINRLWNAVPSIRYAYNIGGGSLILRPFIEKINSEESKYALKFVSGEDSLWMIARSYFKILGLWCKKKGIEIQVTA